jgi:hypothetical protein
MRQFSISMVFVALIVSALPAQAREAPPIRGASVTSTANTATVSDSAPEAAANAEPSSYQHQGLHLRVELGGGYRSMSTEFEGLTMRVDGGGVGVSVIAGGAVRPNLILLGELSYNGIVNPTVHLNDQSAKTQNSSAGVVGFGPGILYYLMPANVSLGASLLLTRASITRDGETLGKTELGFGGALRLGKEWQVGKRNGVGIGSQFALASMKDTGEGATTLLASSFTVAATLTYN